MIARATRNWGGAAFGAALVVLYTGLISGADAITKLVAGAYSAPQLYAFSGAVVVALSLLVDRHSGQRRGIRTGCPAAMALRSAATVLAAICFFQSFRLLAFADVFLFIGLMPIIAGLMSGPIVGEPVRPAAWIALVAGAAGVVVLFQGGAGIVSVGHLWALAAAVTGTFSMVLARYIGRRESNTLAQVFYPNLALLVTMSLALPFVWVPMAMADMGWILAYAALLFLARWVSVEALRRLSAYTVTPLMNLQFVWMVVLGALAFGEFPGPQTYIGVAIVMASGGFLLWQQLMPAGSRRVAA